MGTFDKLLARAWPQQYQIITIMYHRNVFLPNTAIRASVQREAFDLVKFFFVDETTDS